MTKQKLIKILVIIEIVLISTLIWMILK